VGANHIKAHQGLELVIDWKYETSDMLFPVNFTNNSQFVDNHIERKPSVGFRIDISTNRTSDSLKLLMVLLVDV